MERKIIESITEYVNYLEVVQDNQMKRLDDLKDFDSIRLKVKIRPSGKRYYYRKVEVPVSAIVDESDELTSEPDTKRRYSFKYLGTESCEEVFLIKEANYYTESLEAIGSNLKVCRKLLDTFRFTDYDSINEVIPTVYKYPSIKLIDDIRSPNAARWKAENEAYKASCGPWYPEGLKVTTADRKKVRSKSEGMIYNQLFWQNLTFVYELPVTLPYGITRHPDFTVLSEIDWLSIVLIDHEGMYGFEKDRKRYENDMYMYWQNGFIPGVNIFYTFDDPSGGFDISTIQNIIDTRIRPKS